MSSTPSMLMALDMFIHACATLGVSVLNISHTFSVGMFTGCIVVVLVIMVIRV